MLESVGMRDGHAAWPEFEKDFADFRLYYGDFATEIPMTEQDMKALGGDAQSLLNHQHEYNP